LQGEIDYYTPMTNRPTSQAPLFLVIIATILLISACSKEPETFDELVSAGQTAFVRDDYVTARKYLGQAIKIKASDKSVLYFLGISYQRDFAYDSAIVYLKRADILYPNDREINLELYKVSLALQDWENAIKAVGVLVNTGDRIEDFYSQLAELNIKHDNFQAAYVFFGKLIENEPDNPNWYIQQANVAIELDSLPAAVRILDAGLDRFGELEELLLNKAMFLTSWRKFEQAEGILRTLVKNNSANFGYRNNLANVLLAQKITSKKKEAYLILKEIQPLITDPRFPIDSMITALEEELNL